MIVDTHIHLYDPTRPEGVPWPEPEDLIYETTLPDRCTERAIPVGVIGAMVVECSDWVEDNQWVLDQARDEPFILGLVGNLDLYDAEFASNIERFACNPIFRGIRAGIRKPHDLDGVRLLADKDLSLDLSLNEQMITVAQRLPNLRLIINHCAGIKMDGEDPDPAAVQLMQSAAEHANVFCKLSGMMDLRCSIRPAPVDMSHYAPYLDLLWDAFGEDRMIFGSDWPVSDRSQRSYAEVLQLAKDYVTTKPATAEAKVFAGNAQRAYKFNVR